MTSQGNGFWGRCLCPTLFPSPGGRHMLELQLTPAPGHGSVPCAIILADSCEGQEHLIALLEQRWRSH